MCNHASLSSRGTPARLHKPKMRKGPQIHLSVPVMEDSILYNLPNIKRSILYDGIVEQGTLGCHFTHARLRNKTRRDEVMPDLRYKGQMFGLEMDCMALIINFPLTPAISQNPNDLRVVGVLVKLIKWLRRDVVKTIITIDRLALKSTNMPRTRIFLRTWEARLA